MILFAFPPHERLGRAIARKLHARLGRIERRIFSDGERYMRPVTRVRRQDVIVIANTGPDAGAFLDLLILLHALRSNGARSVTLAIPYLAYARQDQSDKPQAPVTIALLAQLLETAGATSVILVDPHSPVAAHSFRIPVHVVRNPILDKEENFLPLPPGGGARGGGASRPIIVAPDTGARHRAQRLARLLGTRDVVVLRKGRPRPNVARVAALSAVDRRRIAGRPAILVDDMIDTAGTITAAAQRLRKAGAKRIAIIATHAVLSGLAITRLRRACIDQIIVSDSLPFTRQSFAKQKFGGLPPRVVSLASTLTGAIRASYRKR